MVIGKHGSTIKGINANHVGWADAHLEQPNAHNGQCQPFFVIMGHPVHVAAIAVEITEIAMEAKHRQRLQKQQNGSPRPKQTIADFVRKGVYPYEWVSSVAGYGS